MTDFYNPLISEALLETEKYKPDRLKRNLRRPLPPDFHQRIASKIVLFFERDTQLSSASKHLQNLFMRNIWTQDRLYMFFDAIEMLLNTDEENVFSGLGLLAVSSDENNKAASAFFQDLLQQLIDDHRNRTKPVYDVDPLKGFQFGYYARVLGDGLISLALINRMEEASIYFYSRLIRQELSREEDLLNLMQMQREDLEEGESKEGTTEEGNPLQAGKHLYDEVIDFVVARAHVSETLRGSENQESMIGLADRLRTARAYMIQTLVDAQMLRRRRKTLKELSSRAASAEDLVYLKEAVEKSLKLFFLQRQYSYYYIIAQKMRLFIKSFSSFWGIAIFLMGYLDVFDILWWQGMVVGIGTVLFGWVMGNDRVFKPFLPQNHSSELEVMLTSASPIVRRTTFLQMEHLILHLLHEPELHTVMPVLPEFMRYLFYVIPLKHKMLLKRGEIEHLLRELDFESSSRKHGPVEAISPEDP